MRAQDVVHTMGLTAITVLTNVRGQTMLFREGDWDDVVHTRLVARSGRMGTAILSDGYMIGMALTSAMSSLAASREFFLGAVRGETAVTLCNVDLVVQHPAPGHRR